MKKLNGSDAHTEYGEAGLNGAEDQFRVHGGRSGKGLSRDWFDGDW